MKLKENLSKEEKKMMRSVFWRSWTMNASRTGATQYHAVGVMYTLLPVINRFFIKTKEERAEALVRHTTWFNATMHINNFIMGLVASMEKNKTVKTKNFDASSITAVKASLMGPLSGIGDSFFWGILRVIACWYWDFISQHWFAIRGDCLLTFIQRSRVLNSLLCVV